jgi:stage V sporulation protein B
LANTGKQSSYLTGAALLAATVALTKVIGAIYKIPLYNILGDEGTAHFGVIYTIYNLLLTISTAGIPVALSRLISAARETGRKNQAREYYRVGMVVFVIVGVVCMAAMLIFAQQLADLMGDYEVALGVRLLAPAVLFACVISVYRGYSQGHKDMFPTSVSQVMEVLGKLIFGLAAAWLLSKAGHSSSDVAAGAIVGVTIGLGLAVPVLFAFKRYQDRHSAARLWLDEPMSTGGTAREILRVSIPITIGSSIMNIITLIDTKLVLSRLQSGAGLDYEHAKVLYGVYTKAVTLFNMPSAFITPVVVSVVPFIAAHLAERRHKEARRVMESSMKLTNLFAMPAACGLCVLARPIFQVLYPGSNAAGPQLLAVLGAASFFVCAYIITNGILQASGHEKLALIGLPAGGIVKIIVNWVLVGYPTINIGGAPIGTLACYMLITGLNLLFIRCYVKTPPRVLRIFARPLLCSLLMSGAAWGVYGLCEKLLLPPLGGGRLGLIVCLGVAILLAVVVYFALAIVLHAVTRKDLAILPKGEKIANLLHIR